LFRLGIASHAPAARSPDHEAQPVRAEDRIAGRGLHLAFDGGLLLVELVERFLGGLLDLACSLALSAAAAGMQSASAVANPASSESGFMFCPLALSSLETDAGSDDAWRGRASFMSLESSIGVVNDMYFTLATGITSTLPSASITDVLLGQEVAHLELPGRVRPRLVREFQGKAWSRR
jgi:hypothetical protein